MNPNIKTTITIMIATILIVTGAYLGGLFSVIGTGEVHFRQDDSCGKTLMYQIDNIRVDYTTRSVNAKLMDPETDNVNDCIPIKVKVTEGNVVLFEFDSDNGGVLIDKMTSSPDYDVLLDDELRLDDKVTYYKIPNGQISDIDFTLYTTVDTTGTTPYDSEKRQIGETYKRLQGVYSFDIDGPGHDSSGRNTGSQLYFHVYPLKATINSTVVSDGEEVTFTVINQFPTAISYTDVCMNFGVIGFAGGLQYTPFCLNTVGTIASGDEAVFTFAIPESNETEYYLRGDVKGISMVLSTITTSGINSADISRYLVDGNKIVVGEYQSDDVKVSAQQEPVYEEPGVTPIVPPEKDGIAWYAYVAIILAFAIVIGMMYMRFRK